MVLTEKEIEEGKKFTTMFYMLSEENKIRVTAYLSALKDKEIADSVKENKLGQQVTK